MKLLPRWIACLAAVVLLAGPTFGQAADYPSRTVTVVVPTAPGGVLGLLGRLGIAEAVGKKALLCVNGDEVVDKVSAGDAEIGSTFLSEIVPMKAVKAVGPLPAPIQNATA